MITPRSESDLAAAIAGTKTPLWVQGGGTRALGTRGAGAVLSTAGLQGIVLYDPGALTLVARAGTPLAEIEAALAAEGQRLAFEPPDWRALLGRDGVPTLGGMIAANASGPRRVAVGACRDFVLGARIVDGTGRVIQSGGRVMKNVTGYDLARLMVGARGRLGVISEVALKVLPAPEATLTLIATGLDQSRALDAMARALAAPYEVTGAAHRVATGTTMLRIEGFGASVTYRAGALAAHLADFGPWRADHDPDIWRDIRDGAAFAGQAGDVWRIVARPSAIGAMMAGAPVDDLVYDWGGGLVWALAAPGVDLRAALGGFEGHATRIRGADTAIATFGPQSAGVARLESGLRARFDPRGVLNPDPVE
ncbi:MAG: FAD-binding protein [Paracoccaceae bacterium]